MAKLIILILLSSFSYANWLDSFPKVKSYLENRKYKNYITDAEKLIRDGKYSLAQGLLSKAEQVNPDDARVEFNRGNIAYRQGKWIDAYSHYLKADYRVTDEEMKHSLDYNRSNTLIMPFIKRDYDPMKLNDNEASFLAAQLMKSKELLENVIKSSDNKDLLKKAKDNLKVVKQVSRELKPRISNMIMGDQSNYTPKLIQLNGDIGLCLRPLLSVDEVTKKELEIYGDLQRGLSQLISSNTIVDRKSCEDFVLNKKVFDRFSSIDLQLKEAKTITNVDGIIETIDAFLSELEFNHNDSDNKYILASNFLTLSKLKGDALLKKSKLQLAKDNHYLASNYASQAIGKYYKGVIGIVNSYIPDLKISKEQRRNSLSKDYPRLVKATESLIKANLNKKVKVESLSDLVKHLASVGGKDKTYSLDSGNINITFDIKSGIKDNSEEFFRDQTNIELTNTPAQLLGDSFKLLTNIQADAFKACQDIQKSTPGEYTVEFEELFEGQHTANSKVTTGKEPAGVSKIKVSESTNFINKSMKLAVGLSKQMNINYRGDETQYLDEVETEFNKIKIKEVHNDVQEKSKDQKKDIAKIIEKIKTLLDGANLYSEDQTGLYDLMNKEIKERYLASIDEYEDVSSYEYLYNNLKARIDYPDLYPNTLGDFLYDSLFKKSKISGKELYEKYKGNNVVLDNKILSIMFNEDLYLPKESASILLKSKTFDKDHSKLKKNEIDLLWNVIEDNLISQGLSIETIGSFDDTKKYLESFIASKKLSEIENVEENDSTLFNRLSGLLSGFSGSAKDFVNDLFPNTSKTPGRNFNTSFNAGRFFGDDGNSMEIEAEAGRPQIAYSGQNYFSIGTNSISNHRSMPLLNAPLEPPLDRIMNPNDKSFTHHFIPSDGYLFKQNLTKIKKVKLLSSGKDITDLVLASKDKATGHYFVPQFKNELVEIESYTDVGSTKAEMKKYNKDIEDYYTSVHDCSVDIGLDPSLEALMKELKEKYSNRPSESNKIIIIKKLRQWIFDNIYYSQTKDTAIEYQKFHTTRGPKDSVFDHMLKIKRGDCDIHNGFLGCILAKEFNVPVRLSVGFMGHSGVVSRRSGHGWLEAWLPEKGGWVNIDATSTLKEPKIAKKESSSFFEFNFPNLNLDFDFGGKKDPAYSLRYNTYECLSNILYHDVKESGAFANSVQVLLDSDGIKDILDKNCDISLSEYDIDRLLMKGVKAVNIKEMHENIFKDLLNYLKAQLINSSIDLETFELNKFKIAQSRVKMLNQLFSIKGITIDKAYAEFLKVMLSHGNGWDKESVSQFYNNLDKHIEAIASKRSKKITIVFADLLAPASDYSTQLRTKSIKNFLKENKKSPKVNHLSLVNKITNGIGQFYDQQLENEKHLAVDYYREVLSLVEPYSDFRYNGHRINNLSDVERKKAVSLAKRMFDNLTLKIYSHVEQNKELKPKEKLQFVLTPRLMSKGEVYDAERSLGNFPDLNTDKVFWNKKMRSIFDDLLPDLKMGISDEYQYRALGKILTSEKFKDEMSNHFIDLISEGKLPGVLAEMKYVDFLTNFDDDQTKLNELKDELSQYIKHPVDNEMDSIIDNLKKEMTSYNLSNFDLRSFYYNISKDFLNSDYNSIPNKLLIIDKKIKEAKDPEVKSFFTNLRDIIATDALKHNVGDNAQSLSIVFESQSIEDNRKYTKKYQDESFDPIKLRQSKFILTPLSDSYNLNYWFMNDQKLSNQFQRINQVDRINYGNEVQLENLRTQIMDNVIPRELAAININLLSSGDYGDLDGHSPKLEYQVSPNNSIDPQAKKVVSSKYSEKILNPNHVLPTFLSLEKYSLGMIEASVQDRRPLFHKNADQSFFLTLVLNHKDEKVRGELLTKFLNSKFFLEGPDQVVRKLSYLLQFTDDYEFLKEHLVEFVERLDTLGALKKVSTNHRELLDDMMVFYGYANPKDKKKIAEIFQSNGIKFDLHQQDIMHPLIAKNLLGPIQPLSQEVLKLKIDSADPLVKEYDANLYETVLRLKELSGKRTNEMKESVSYINTYVEEEKKNLALNKNNIPENDFSNQVEHLLTKSKTVTIVNTSMMLSDRAKNKAGFNYIDSLNRITNSWSETSKIINLKNEDERNDDRFNLSLGLLTDIFRIFKDVDLEKQGVVKEYERFLNLFKELSKDINDEQRVSLYFILLNKMFDDDVPDQMNEYIYEFISTTLNRFPDDFSASLIERSLMNKKIVSNKKRLAYLINLGLSDKYFSNYDGRKKVENETREGYNLLSSAFDQLFLPYAMYYEETQGITRKQMIDPDEAYILNPRLRDRFITNRDSFILNDQFEGIVALRNFEDNRVESLRDEYGVALDKEWRDHYSPSKKIEILSTAIANGVFAPNAMLILQEELRTQVLMKDAKQTIMDKLNIGFYHYTLDKYFGEVWFDKKTGEKQEINELRYRFQRMGQKEKLEFIKKNRLPYKDADLMIMNESLEEVGLAIDLPGIDKYQWEILEN